MDYYHLTNQGFQRGYLALFLDRIPNTNSPTVTSLQREHQPKSMAGGYLRYPLDAISKDGLNKEAQKMHQHNQQKREYYKAVCLMVKLLDIIFVNNQIPCMNAQECQKVMLTMFLFEDILE